VEHMGSTARVVIGMEDGCQRVVGFHGARV
jgi:hypothetical protein